MFVPPNFIVTFITYIRKKTIIHMFGFGYSIYEPLKILPMKWHHHHYFKHLSPHPVLTQTVLQITKKIKLK